MMICNHAKHQFILGLHPHGIIPLQALLYVAVCDQYAPETYGFGAAAGVLFHLPIFRQIFSWLTAGPADYASLLGGLVDGRMVAANRVHRFPENLFILPGGIAEIFTATPGVDRVVLKGRTGLCRLSLQSGAFLIPTFCFGGNDFFSNFVTQKDGFLGTFSRKLRASLTLFWGQYGLPIPYPAKVTMVFGQPIFVEKYGAAKLEEGKKVSKPPQKEIDALHEVYVEQFRVLYNKYKKVCRSGGKDLIVE